MIRKLSSGGYRLYSCKVDEKTGRRRTWERSRRAPPPRGTNGKVQYFNVN